jgi:hypothetical protein
MQVLSYRSSNGIDDESETAKKMTKLKFNFQIGSIFSNKLPTGRMSLRLQCMLQRLQQRG